MEVYFLYFILTGKVSPSLYYNKLCMLSVITRITTNKIDKKKYTQKQ